MVVTSSQMIAAEQAVIAGGISAEVLMEEAAEGIFHVITQFFPRPGTAVLYLGKGNNAGDALVVARHLHDAGWKLMARCISPPAGFKELPAKHWKAIEGKVTVLPDCADIPREQGCVLILDGILGIGATTEPLRGAYDDAVREMNTLRRDRHAFTVAIDLPSGLGAGDGCVEADLTVTIGQVKTSLLEDKAAANAGRLAVAPLEALRQAKGDATQRLLTSRNLLSALPCRSFEFHKGQAGRVGVIAGSRGFLGAAVLASSGALRGGAGLVTLFVKEEMYPLMVPLVPAEVMVKPVRDYRDVLHETLDVLAIGPGLGANHDEEVLEVLSHAETPAVVDADALNLIARRGVDVLEECRGPRLLTPHPGEMARLAAQFPGWEDLSRRDLARAFAAQFPGATLLLKGSRTLIAAAGRPVSFNSTGNPGMASGGMGDVLTGLCAALAGQKVDLYDAACLGAWLSGRAAECAVAKGGCSQESLTATDVLRELGSAFQDLKRLVF
jgi:hydroxyethylthiazole kinase-like uncharacterized protein yjeF